MSRCGRHVALVSRDISRAPEFPCLAIFDKHSVTLHALVTKLLRGRSTLTALPSLGICTAAQTLTPLCCALRACKILQDVAGALAYTHGCKRLTSATSAELWLNIHQLGCAPSSDPDTLCCALRACKILQDVAGALAYMHSRGYVHCDCKTPNILLDRCAPAQPKHTSAAPCLLAFCLQSPTAQQALQALRLQAAHHVAGQVRALRVAVPCSGSCRARAPQQRPAC